MTLLYSVIGPILNQAEFSQLRCALHVSLSTLVKDMDLLTAEEQSYVGNPLTHTDFLFYRRLDKTPVLAVELDGTSFHRSGSEQAARDAKKTASSRNVTFLCFASEPMKAENPVKYRRLCVTL